LERISGESLAFTPILKITNFAKTILDDSTMIIGIDKLWSKSFWHRS